MTMSQPPRRRRQQQKQQLTMGSITNLPTFFLLVVLLSVSSTVINSYTISSYSSIIRRQSSSSSSFYSSFQKRTRQIHSDKINNNVMKLYNRLTKQEVEIEEARIKILASRRQTIRNTLKAAENFRNNRIANGDVPEIDPITNKPIKPNSDDNNRSAISITAFVVAIGVIILRIGGRAALLNVVGLDFLNNSPELKDNLELIINYTDNMNYIIKLLFFIVAWTIVKVSCIDAGGVVLALSSGILFNGIVEGAILSAASATIGSYVAFTLAKLNTPFRTKALELVDQYPSLRSINKVVTKEGIKAIVTLRLAPVLPIPIGLYNYIYGVTNVPVSSFLAGIFLGSLKPYFLDSYLGYFGKDIVQGTNDPSGIQDYLLVGALGISVLIGVFASQLSTEIWDTVIDEVEIEKQTKLLLEQQNANTTTTTDDGIVRHLVGITIPDFIIGAQLAFQQADKRLQYIVESEYQAKVWNYTSPTFQNNNKGSKTLLPDSINPAKQIGSPEIEYFNTGINLVDSLCEGFVLSPVLFKAFFKYSDPLYNETQDNNLLLSNTNTNNNMIQGRTIATLYQGNDITTTTGSTERNSIGTSTNFISPEQQVSIIRKLQQQQQQQQEQEQEKDATIASTGSTTGTASSSLLSTQELLSELNELRIEAVKKLSIIDDKIQRNGLK